MAKSIRTVRDRAALKVRREPHWLVIRRGCSVGYRRLSDRTDGTWCAKYRNSETDETKQKTLGDMAQFPPSERFQAAVEAAEHYFKHLGAGGASEDISVADVCRRYVKHLLDDGRTEPAHDAEGRFVRRVYTDEIAVVMASRLTPIKLREWRRRCAASGDGRDRGQRAAASVNRDIAPFRAALNFALDQGYVTSNASWLSPLKPAPNADARRTDYLDRAQRDLLAASCPDDLRAFVLGLSLLPLRPGAVAKLVVGDFDRRRGQIHVGKDKNGRPRCIPLPEFTVDFLLQQARGKLPAAPLFSRLNGSKWNRFAWRDGLRLAVKKAGLPDSICAYTFRHSVITDLILNGLDVMTVAAISDTSIEMIQKHYGHLRDENARVALGKLAAR